MVLVFKSLLQILSGNDILLATTKFGDIRFIDNMLVVPIDDVNKYVYDFNKDTWLHQSGNTILNKVDAPKIDVDANEITVFDNRFFDFLVDYSITPKDYYRHVRAIHCFPIVNRGKLWYDRLTGWQYAELESWYDAWLNVTKTFVYPIAPAWLNKKLNELSTEEIY